MVTSFTYSKSTDFPNGLNRRNLIQDIDSDSTITQVHNSVDVDADIITITFATDLSPAEVTALDALIVSHDPYSDETLEIVPGGSRYIYQKQIFSVANEIQYARVILPNNTWRGVRLFLINGGSSGAVIRVGLYSHKVKKPKTKLIAGSRTLVAADDGKDLDVLFSAPFSASDANWIAVSSTSATPKFVGSDTLRAKFHAIRFETTIDGSLPTTATVANGNGAILFAALLS